MTQSNKFEPSVEFYDDHKTIQIIGHFDGYICGLLTTIRNLVHLKFIKGSYDFGEFEDGTITSIIKIKSKKDYNKLVDLITTKVNEYQGKE